MLRCPNPDCGGTRFTFTGTVYMDVTCIVTTMPGGSLDFTLEDKGPVPTDPEEYDEQIVCCDCDSDWTLWEAIEAYDHWQALLPVVDPNQLSLIP